MGWRSANRVSSCLGGHVLPGSGALRLVGNLEAVEQQLAELLRRVEVERTVGQAIQVRLVGGDLLFQLQRVLAQGGDADRHSGVLHRHQQRHQRHLDLLPQIALPVAVDRIQQGLQQLRRNVGALPGVGRKLGGRQAGGGELLGGQRGALQQRDRRLAGDQGRVVQVVLRQQRQVVRAVRLYQLVRQARVQQPPAQRDAVPAQRRHPALQIMADLGDVRVLPKARQLAQLGGSRRALVGERQVGRGALLPAKRHSRQRHPFGVAGAAHREQAHRLLLQQFLKEPGPRRCPLHQVVVVGHVVQRA